MFENDHRIPEITPLPPMFFVVGGQLVEQSKIVKKESIWIVLAFKATKR